MIHFDQTTTGDARHLSGLVRVSRRLRQEAGGAASDFRWPHDRAHPAPGDWFVTTELFSGAERPGFEAWLEGRGFRAAAVFHDAIPLKHPHITWPRSVARHADYLRLLAGFDHVFAVSEASRRELEGFWDWQRTPRRASVSVLTLGADAGGGERRRAPERAPSPGILSIGILEPRKNPDFLLDVVERLWAGGCGASLHWVGRVNPLFGRAAAERLRRLERERPGLIRWHQALPDAALAELFGRVRVTAFPTRAEGCGLPVSESLWQAVPCVCSDLPVLREQADGGGCVTAAPDDPEAWIAALVPVLTDDGIWHRLAAEAAARPLPRWRDTWSQVEAGLG